MTFTYNAWKDNGNGTNEVSAQISQIGYYGSVDRFSVNGTEIKGELDLDAIVTQLEALEQKGYERDYTVKRYSDSPEDVYWYDTLDSFRDTFPVNEVEIRPLIRLCGEMELGYIENPFEEE